MEKRRVNLVLALLMLMFLPLLLLPHLLLLLLLLLRAYHCVHSSEFCSCCHYSL